VILDFELEKTEYETFSCATAIQRRGPVKVLTNGTGFGWPERLGSKSVSDVIIDIVICSIGIVISLCSTDFSRVWLGFSWSRMGFSRLEISISRLEMSISRLEMSISRLEMSISWVETENSWLGFSFSRADFSFSRLEIGIHHSKFSTLQDEIRTTAP